MYQVRLKNNVSFQCSENQNILDAALNSGIFLEYSCLDGRCRSCSAKVLNGTTVELQDNLSLNKDEKREGNILTCISCPTSDVELDIEDLSEYDIPRSKTFPAKVDELLKVSADVLKVVLRLPPRNNFIFKPGQYVNIIRGGVKRSYSVAKHLFENKLEFYIKNYKGGEMSEFWFNDVQINDMVRIEGPKGSFFLRNNLADNLVFLATGTGIAPIQAILEDFYSNFTDILEKKRVIVLWGARNKESFFLTDTFFKSFSGLEYIPVLSRKSDNWNGRYGYVQDILCDLLKDFNSTDVYACGSETMINSARKKLIDLGLPSNKFYSDAFLCTN